MKISGIAFLATGIILGVVGILLTAGVIVAQIPFLGYLTWIPISVGGILIVVGIVLLIIGR